MGRQEWPDLDSTHCWCPQRPQGARQWLERPCRFSGWGNFPSGVEVGFGEEEFVGVGSRHEGGVGVVGSCGLGYREGGVLG